MAQAAADPLAVEFTWIDVLTLASVTQKPTGQYIKKHYQQQIPTVIFKTLAYSVSEKTKPTCFNMLKMNKIRGLTNFLLETI